MHKVCMPCEAVAAKWLFKNATPLNTRSVETFAEEKGEFARLSSFEGAIVIGDLVKGTLGPKGMDKILVAHGRSAGQVEHQDGLDGEDCREGEDEGKGDNPDQVRLGRCDLIEQVMIAEDTLLRFSGVPLGEACSDEADRLLHDALCVLAAEKSGEESIAMEAFGLALL
ncbi:chaperonin [Culex quinquefasciatus]|uniref:Chaperonin n=1 Tax=Culex quinquefasciatus TaxID=7176 RepID=B0WJ67_CULQU|nr:chaperonin [Culex quinquefasciatus]|eukprot:XP_001848751.1 chaperonin [Culex quinquefasciatus]